MIVIYAGLCSWLGFDASMSTTVQGAFPFLHSVHIDSATHVSTVVYCRSSGAGDNAIAYLQAAAGSATGLPLESLALLVVRRKQVPLCICLSSCTCIARL